jgi:hypothetical protein
MANSGRPATPTSPHARGNTPPRRGDWGEWAPEVEEQDYWPPSGGQHQRSRSQPPGGRYPQQQNHNQWRQNRSQDWRDDQGSQWRQERRLSFSSQEDPGTPRGDRGRGQWPRDAPKGGGQYAQGQSSSSGRGPPVPQVVQAIQDQKPQAAAPSKGKGDTQGKGELGKGKGKGKGGVAPVPSSGGSTGGSVKGDGKCSGKGKGKGEPMECTVCKGMHRTSMAQGTGPIPYVHDYKRCEHSRRIWQEKLKM